MWWGTPEQRFIVKKLYVGDVSLQRYALSECVWLRLEIKQPHVSILKKHDISTHLTIPLPHLTSCTPTKSNLYLANSLAAAISEPALYKTPNIQSTKSHVPLSLLWSYQSISPGPSLCLWIFRNKIGSLSEQLLAPHPTSKLEDHPCRLSATIYSIYSQLPSILEAVPPSAT